MNYAELKKGGMMRQREAGVFSVRLHITGGKLTTAQLQAIKEAAETYGCGEIHLTARQGIEIPGVKQENLADLKEDLMKKGVSVGVCGPTIRTVTACQGCRICPLGVLDSPRIAEMVDEEFYGKPVPHKFKVGISGCMNNCLKAEENDIGIKGAVCPGWKMEDCTHCGLCAAACPVDAITVDKDGSVHEIDFEKCIYCGDCIRVCPFDAMTAAKEGFFVYAGGKFGRFPKLGEKIPRFFEGEDVVVSVVGAAVEFFRKWGNRKERFGDTIEKVGFGKFLGFVFSRIDSKEGSDEEANRHYG